MEFLIRSTPPRWCLKVKSVESVDERRWEVVHKPMPLRPPMELTLEHLERRRPESLTLREEDEVAVFEVEYRLDQGGARFTQISTIAWKRLPRVFHGTSSAACVVTCAGSFGR